MTKTRVVILGGGTAAVEALLGLHALAADRVELIVLADTQELVNRPSSVVQPFRRSLLRRLDVGRIVTDCGGWLQQAKVEGVDLGRKEVETRIGERVPYDALVVAIGAVRHDPLPGALTFRGPESVEAFRALLQELHLGRVHDLVFTLPAGTSWPLPLYELALMTAGRLRALAVRDTRLAFATPEDHPLGMFGAPASEAVAELLREAGVQLVTGLFPTQVEGGRLHLSPGRRLAADQVVTLPQLRGPALPGLPHDNLGFIETDPHGRVVGTEDVYAAGDVTAFPIKQGGLAAQQADAVAETIAARAGADVDPLPFQPLLRGLLLAGSARRFLSTDLAGDQDLTSRDSELPLWWPPTKVAARHLGAYLVSHSEFAPHDAPDDPDAIPVEVRDEAVVAGDVM